MMDLFLKMLAATFAAALFLGGLYVWDRWNRWRG